MNLDASQQAVVDSNDPVVVVKAGPGSGKTATLAAVVARLATQMDRREIHVLTFSRAAAEEIRSRIAGPRGVDVTTIHGLAFRVVCSCHQALGYARKPALYSEDQRKLLAHDVERMMPRATPVTHARLLEALHKLSSGEVRRKQLEGAMEQAVELYEKLLRRDGAADYGLVMLDAIEAMSKGMGRSWPLGALVVDEAQDIDRLQAAFLALFAPSRVILVGDPDQSIYSFRGAVPEWMDAMPGATKMRLAHTYRCLPRVMEAAFALLGERREISHIGESTSTGEVRISPLGSTLRGVIPDVGTVAVLCRTNSTAGMVFAGLAGSGVDASLHVSGERVLEDDRIRLVLALTLWPELPDAKWVTNAAMCAWKATDLTVKKVMAKATSEGITRLAAAKEMIAEIRDFYEVGASVTERLTDALGKILPGERPEQWLMMHAARFVRSTDPDDRTAANLWWYLAGCDSRLPSEAPARVQVMTMHASKGREFDSVVLIGGDRNDERPSAEDRRLFYVAATRARSLVIACRDVDRSWWIDELEAHQKEGGGPN